MVRREDLYRLIEELPEAMLEPVHRMLEQLHFAAQQPAAAQTYEAKTLKAAAGPLLGDSDARRNVDHDSSHRWQDDALLVDTRWNFQGYEVLFHQKWTLSPDGKKLVIGQQISGPRGEVNQDLVFETS